MYHPHFVAAWAAQRMRTEKELLHQLLQLFDLQCSVCSLLAMSASPRTNHALHTVLPPAVAPHAPARDAAIWHGRCWSLPRRRGQSGRCTRAKRGLLSLPLSSAANVDGGPPLLSDLVAEPSVPSSTCQPHDRTCLRNLALVGGDLHRNRGDSKKGEWRKSCGLDREGFPAVLLCSSTREVWGHLPMSGTDFALISFLVPCHWHGIAAVGTSNAHKCL